MNRMLLPLVLLSLGACAPEAPQASAPATTAAAPAAARAPAVEPAAPSQPAAASAASATDAEVDARIDKVLGGHAAYRSVLERLQAAIAADDRSAVAGLVRYPFEARLLDNKLRIDNAQGFLAHYDEILTPEIAQAITAQRYGDVFVSQNGVMLGSGQVWINGVCHDAACADVDVKIVTLQQGG